MFRNIIDGLNCGAGTNIQTNEDVAIKLVSIVDIITLMEIRRFNLFFFFTVLLFIQFCIIVPFILALN